MGSSYQYDGANRLTQASATDGSGKSLTYGYDQYGNASCTAGSQNVACIAYTFSTSNNRLSGYSYDAAGNLLSDGTCSYTYDGEERMNTATCGGTTTTYIYDAEGRRVAKAAGTCVIEEYVLDLAGNVISAYGPSPTQSWLRGEIYAGARHVATYTNGSTYFTQADELGTERARTDVNGYLCGSATSQPFGDNASSGGCFTLSHNFFTGQESDPETGLTFMHARHDNNRFYRFMTPDPHNAGANPTDPQTWNMYAYVRNNPTTMTDPSGMEPTLFTAGGFDSANGTIQGFQPTGQNGQETSGSNNTTPQQTTPGVVDTIDANIKANGKTLKEPMVAKGEVAPIGEVAAAGARAVELANAMGKTKDFVTIAVTETQEGVSVVSSSENALRPAVQNMLNEGEVAARGAGHAEVTGVNAAKQMGLTPTGVAASRGICPTCAQFLRDVGVAVLSALRASPL